MIKLFAAVAAALIATPVVAQTEVPAVVVTVDSALALDANHQLLTIHKDDHALDLKVVGCPLAKTGTPYYLIAVPTVGLFMTDKAGMDKALKTEGQDFGKASHDVISANDMCVVVSAKEAARI